MAGTTYSQADAKQIADAPDLDPSLYLDPIKFMDEVILVESYMDRCSAKIQYAETFEDKGRLRMDGTSELCLALHRTEQKLYKIRKIPNRALSMKIMHEMETDFAVRMKIEHSCILQNVGQYQTLESMNIVEEHCGCFGSLDRIFAM